MGNSALRVDVLVDVGFESTQLPFRRNTQLRIVDGDQILRLKRRGMRVRVAENLEEDAIFGLPVLHVVPPLGPLGFFFLLECGQETGNGGAQPVGRVQGEWDGKGCLSDVQSNRRLCCNH